MGYYGFASTPTAKGHRLDEAVSALQKACRRSLEPMALYFGSEIYSTEYKEYAWKRLLVIACEDIGIAGGIGYFSRIHGAYKTWKKSKDINLFLEAIALTARSQKSRLACHASIATEFNGFSPNLPEWVNIDKPIDTIFADAIAFKYEPMAIYFGMEIFKAKSTKASWDSLFIAIDGIKSPIQDDFKSLREFWNAMHTKKDGAESLPFFQAILMACRLDDLQVAIELEGAIADIPDLLEVPDFALDCHTARGKKLKRHTVHFYDEAGLLIPASPFDDIYEEIAKTVEGYYGIIPTKAEPRKLNLNTLETVIPKSDQSTLLGFM